MFISQTRLPQLLPPTSYWSVEQHQAEMERIFSHGWHFVGTLDDLPRPGDFFTFHLLGQPILVRNGNGQVHAFLNTCAHRRSMLTSRPCGSSAQLVCQYHGWEYDDAGTVRKIPDGKSFAGIRRADFRLNRVRVETCGRLIFVSLAPAGTTLAEYLGPHTGEVAEKFSEDWRQVLVHDRPHEANWKIPLENSLESYHLPMMHPQTFGTYPHEEAIQHTLGLTSTRFEDPWELPALWPGVKAQWALRWIRRDPKHVYAHLHCFPNLACIFTDEFSAIEQFLPTSPTTCWHHYRLFCHRGEFPGLVPRLILRRFRQLIVQGAVAVLREDASVFADIQRGTQASRQPGVLSAREERVYAFQEWLVGACEGAAGLTSPVRPEAVQAAE